jgi:hypothetical protein
MGLGLPACGCAVPCGPDVGEGPAARSEAGDGPGTWPSCVDIDGGSPVPMGKPRSPGASVV